MILLESSPLLTLPNLPIGYHHHETSANEVTVVSDVAIISHCLAYKGAGPELYN